MIGIINYGSGNIHAIANLHKRANIDHMVSSDYKELSKADKLILPGVGAFDETMSMIKQNNLFDFLNEEVLVKKKMIFGVCVGMHILSESSEEGTENGFGWIQGKVKKIDTTYLPHKPYLPHLGWNSIIGSSQHSLLKDIDHNEGFYFLHSYFFDCKLKEDVIATTNYGKDFPCFVNHNNVFGVQFHPEKSHNNGIKLFENFSKL